MDEELQKALINLISPIYSATSGKNDNGAAAPFDMVFNQMWAKLDKQSGGSAQARAAVSAVKDKDDKLEVLRAFYPDAVPVGDTKHFMFWDKDRKVPVLFDEQRLTGRDALEMIPFAGEMVGGALGAAAGGGSSMGVGAVAGAGAGSAAGRVLAEQGSMALTGATDPRSAGEQAREALAVGAAGSIGQFGGGAIGKGLGRLAGAGNPVVEAGVEAAARQDVPLSLGQRGTRGVGFMEEGISRMPGGSGRMERFSMEQQEAIEGLSDRVKQALSLNTDPADAAMAHEVLRTSFEAMGDNFKMQREILDLAVEKTIGANTPVMPAQTMQHYADLLQGMQGAEGTMAWVYSEAMPRLSTLAQDAQNNGGMVPFRALRKMRSMIGTIMDDPEVGGQVMDNLSPIYRALSKDIEEAAMQSGPEAKRALRMHDTYVKHWRDPQNPINLSALSRVVGNDKDLAAFKFATEQMNKSGQRLAAIRAYSTPDEWAALSTSVWDQLGHNPATDAWEAGRFLRNWNKMDTVAKEALFMGGNYGEAASAIDDLTKVIGLTEKAAKWRNHSNTASALISAMTVGGAGLAMAGSKGAGTAVAVPLIASNVAARAFTNQTFVNAMANGIRALNVSPNALPAVLGRMGMAIQNQQDPELEEWFENVFSGLIR